MALYLIGDIQGCDDALQRLLDTLAFSPSQDTLYVLGDLVNRGPASAAVLRRLKRYGASARCVLGNHDLHLLALAQGARMLQRHDTVQDVLAAKDRADLLAWLHHQPLAIHLKQKKLEVLMVHAGVLPAWDAIKTIALADEVQTVLRSSERGELLQQMYGNTPARWSDSLTGMDRLRVIVNALTRLRFCTPDGTMEFDTKEGAGKPPAGCVPWFDAPNRQTAGITLAFGHWSTLGWMRRPDVLNLDTGCVWGGALSAVRLDTLQANQVPELIQVQCKACQTPGKQTA
jgi:bis(5'-nucleosyl)-tetraphosphatase (symmetrical)